MEQINKTNRFRIQEILQQSLEFQSAILKHHCSLVQTFVNTVLSEEVNAVCGERYEHDHGEHSRWGYNRGSVRVNGSRIKVEVPRIRNNRSKQFRELKSYKELRKSSSSEDLMLKVLHGISTRDYKLVTDRLGESFGISKSSVSNRFIEGANAALKKFEEERFEQHHFVALFIDGKTYAQQQMIIVLGVTLQGEKIPIGLVQSASEKSHPVAQLLRNLIERGLRFDKGLLCVIDGSKGIRKAVEDVFGNNAIVQRCRWHKCRNVQEYLSQQDQKWFKRVFYQALDCATYRRAKNALLMLHKELERINRHAAESLKEGMEELLTLHKLGMNQELKRSFGTTNCIENLNSQLAKHTDRVKSWKDSAHRCRWIAVALLAIRGKLRKVPNYKKLPDLAKKLKQHVKMAQNAQAPLS